MTKISENNPQQGCFQKVKYLLSHITAEPIMVFFYLPYVMLLLVNANLFLEKSCRVNLQLDDSVCDGLAARNTSMYNQTDEAAVQKLVTTMNIWRNILQSILPIIFLSFMGSWSDKYKRLKPALLFPVFGGVIKAIGLFLSVGFFHQINMEATGAMEVIPSALLGGAPTMSMSVNNYVSAVSSAEMLTLRIGLVSLCIFVSFTLGVASGGILLQLIGYYGIYSIALTMYITSILYTVFYLKEIQKGGEEIKNSVLGNLKDFFNFKHVVGTAKTTFRKREKNHRLRIILLFLLTVIEMGPRQGEINVVYLFTRIRFQWSEVEFSVYYIYHLVLNVTGLAIALVVFSRMLKIDDALIGIIGCFSKVASGIMAAFAPNSLIFYLAALLEMFSTVINVVIRSIITKLVAGEELGKILAVISMFEALPTLIYGPLYNMVYKQTINSLPGTFFLVGGGLTSPAIFIFIWFYMQHRKDQKEECNLKEKSAVHMNKIF